MKRGGAKLQRFFKGLFKSLVYLIFFLIFLVALTGVVSTSSQVQTWLAQKAVESISERVGVNIGLERLYLSGLRTINLEGVLILDHHQDTMISVSRLQADISLKNIIAANTLYLTNIELKDPLFYLHKSASDTAFNINYFLESMGTDNPDTLYSEPLKVVLEELKLSKGNFILQNDTFVNNSGHFDPNHIRYTGINAYLSSFEVNADRIMSQIDSISLQELPGNQNLRLRNTRFSMSQEHLTLENLDLRYNKTMIRDSIALVFDGWESWSDFANSVEFSGNLNRCFIRSADLAYFIPAIGDEKHDIRLRGEARGNLNNLSLKNFDLRYGKNSYVLGNLIVEGLPEIDNTIISLQINTSRVLALDLIPYLKTRMRQQIKNLKYIKLRGRFEGFYYDFVADGIFQTALGDIQTDINFKLPEKAPAKYSGSLSSEKFKLGRLLGREDLVQNINIIAEVDGSGLSLRDADVKMNAILLNSSINNYKYEEIRFDARLKENLFDGLLEVKDSALNLEIAGLVNLDPDIEKIDVTGQIFNSDLRKINFSDKEGSIRGQMDFDFTGLALDRTFGKGDLKDVEVLYDNKYLFLDTLSVHSNLNGEERDIEIISDLINGRMTGNFKLRNLFHDLKVLLHEYRLQLRNREDEIESYYASKEPSNSKYTADWNIHFTDVNPISSLLFPKLYLSHNIDIAGRISMGNTRIFNLHTRFDSLFYDSYRFYDNEIDISSSKFNDSSEILAFVLLQSGKQEIEDVIDGEALRFEGLWNDKEIIFDTYFKQLNDSNYANIRGKAIFNIDSTFLTFDRSDFRAIDKNWSVPDNNELVIYRNKLKVSNLEITTGFESIRVNGNISDNPADQLNVAFSNYNLRNISPIIDQDISGVLNADLTLSDILNQVQLFGNVRANDCTIGGFLIGDISGSSRWDNSFNAIVSKYEINRLGKNVLNVEGMILPKGDTTLLNLMAKLTDTNLELAEPFTQGLMSDITGKASGYLTLKGTSSQPVLEGNVNVTNGAFRIDFLNTFYTFEDQLTFNTDNIRANNLVLKDEQGNRAIVNGGVYHVGFSNPVIDLSGELSNFQVLNTKIEDNSLFYGQANASGNINFLGSFSDIQIRANLKSEKGTFVHIPLDNYTELEKESHITFLSEVDTAHEMELLAREEIDLSGIDMELNLNMTPDAHMEIILDRQTGDIIKGRGNGELSLEIDTRGDFNIYGFYEILEGSYSFTLLNIVNKEFNVKNGGRISWAGDPYEGQVDLTGTYSQNVSLKPLMLSADSIFLNSPQASRRHPVDVNLHLTGPLLSPEFQFGIDVKDPPTYQGYDFNNDFLAFQNRIQNNEDALNREVFSLIVLRQFSQNQSALQQSAGNNLSELFTNQLSNYLSSVNENLEINLDLGGLSQEDLNDLQLRFSYTFLEGRLRVTREGTFINSGDEADVSSVIGDWTIEYALTEDGRLKAKFFNRNNPNIYQTGTNATTTTTGASLKYTRSFDKFDDLLIEGTTKKQKRKQEKSKKKMPARNEEQEANKIEQR